MTKKTYEKIGEIIYNLYIATPGEPQDSINSSTNWLDGRCDVLVELAEALAKEFEADNPKFDKNIFFNKCGMSILRLQE